QQRAAADPGRAGAGVRGVLHDQDARHRAGDDDRPASRRGARRPDRGRGWPGRGVRHHPAARWPVSRSLRVAVADDEPDMLLYLRTTLPLLGHEVVAAARTGEELVERCRTAHPDLVITDIKMPGLDGIAAAAAIFRERPTPVILVSAYHDSELVERAG